MWPEGVLVPEPLPVIQDQLPGPSPPLSPGPFSWWKAANGRQQLDKIPQVLGEKSQVHLARERHLRFGSS